MPESRNPESDAPLASLDEWDDDVRRRYPPAIAGEAPPVAGLHKFRNYEEGTRDGVREFYRLNHEHQTVEFATSMRKKYVPLRRERMSIWQAIDRLNAIVDDSDPDTQVSQIEHAVQTAEAVRGDGHPRWFVLVGLIHDLGKVLCLWGEPQWAVVGDTFPVGCGFSDKVVLSEFFAANPDRRVARFQTPCGIYDSGCGLDNVMMSWGHDEYLYQVVRAHLPPEALYMIRYHSFYAAHRERAYEQLMDDQDKKMFEWVRRFNPYDLYTKTDERPDIARLLPWYRDLVDEYLPGSLAW